MFQKAEIANGNTFPSMLNAECLSQIFDVSLEFITFARPINRNILLDKIKSDFQTQQVFCGGTTGGTEIKYVQNFSFTIVVHSTEISTKNYLTTYDGYVCPSPK